MKLLLEAEVAEILGCSRQKVKRLRLNGRLTYIPGRPVLIDEADLSAFMEEERIAKERRDEARRPKPKAPPTREQARKWAQIQILLRRR